MNKSIINREGWHTTRHGFRYYVEGGKIIYGLARRYDGSDIKMFQYKVVLGNFGRVIGYKRIKPLARYYNLTRYVWRAEP